MKAFVLGGLLALMSACPVRSDSVDLEPVTCAQFKAGYDTLSSRPFSAEDGSLATAIDAIVDNHLLMRDKTRTSYATREQLTVYLSSLKPLDALIWLQTTYTTIELQYKICSGSAYEQKRLELRAPRLATVRPGAKSCGGSVPDLSKPLGK